MPSVISCPACERRLHVPPALVGESVKCPTCGETFTADLDAPPPRPVADEAPAPLPPPDDEDDRLPRRRPGRDNFRRRGRTREKPANVTTVGVLMLIGGIFGILLFLGLPLASGFACCLWPGTYYSLVMGILVIIKGSQLLGDESARVAPPRWAAVMMIVNIASGDVANLAMGIVCLCLLNDPEVEKYFRGRF